MAFWINSVVRLLLVFENYLVAQIRRSPAFNHMVQRVHRRVQDRKYGRDPHEPLRPGEATELPDANGKTNGFLKYFIEELRNQVRGTPTNPPPPPPPPGSRPPRK